MIEVVIERSHWRGGVPSGRESLEGQALELVRIRSRRMSRADDERTLREQLEATPPERLVELLLEQASHDDDLRALQGEGVHVLDLHAALQADGAAPSAYYLDRVHFTPEGHRVVGEALGRALQPLLPAAPPLEERPPGF